MSISALPKLTTAGCEIDTSPENFGWLLDSNDALHDFEELRRRMERDGYLFLPGFFKREEVRNVRLNICEVLNSEGLLDTSEPIEKAVAPEGVELYFRPDIANGPAKPEVDKLIYGPQIMEFYTHLLGGPATHYDFTWLRTIAPGTGTYPHCDVVYMGRGTHNVFTAWIPFGDVPLNVGGLIVLEGSHRNTPSLDGYRTMDVDTACSNVPGKSQTEAADLPFFGALGDDTPGLRSQLGCRLLTCPEYKMGDLLTFSIYTVHGSLDNHSREIRISSDSRYQLASEPIDERWVGEEPPGHGGGMIRKVIC
jgi:hypothetical protein